MIWALAGVAAFNLICSGSYVTGLLDTASDMGVKNVELRERTYTFRIDLDARRWCVDKCTSTEAIAKIADHEILLANDRPTSVPVERHLKLNRGTGDFFYLRRAGSFQELSQGNCATASFAGFPPQRF